MNSLSIGTVVLVVVLAVVLPVIFRIFSSPVLLILLSPFLVISFGLSFLAFNVFLGHLVDKNAHIKNNLHYAARPVAFSTPAAWQAVLTRSRWSQNTPQSFPPLCPGAPLVSSALNDILVMIVRDFVLVWYKDISSSPSFPMAVSSVLHASLDRLLDRASTIDLSAFMVKRILPKITAHIEQFRQSEIALRGAGLERKLTQSEELDLLLANKYSGKGGKLHPAVGNLSTTFTKQTEEIHLRQLVDKALPHVLPDVESRSQALRLVVREILVCSVLQPVMNMISDPDFWNRAIDQVITWYLQAGAAIHQQKLITKVRNVLEAQSPRSQPRVSTTVPLAAELITIRTDLRQFESFLRSINRCSSLLDARRLKNDVVGEIRRTRLLLATLSSYNNIQANHEKDDWINGEKTENVVAFLDRLYTAKRRVEERIVVLGGDDGHDPKSGLALRDVLGNPSSLSYFMEFMDRRHRSLLVQFWLTVESFKNPLESVDSESSDDEDEPLQDSSSSATITEDISMINDLYFSRSSLHPTLASISKKHIDVIRIFAESQSPPTPSAQHKVRRSVMLAQRQVEKDMEQDFEDFERSELWFRVIGDTDLGRQANPQEYMASTSKRGRQIYPYHPSPIPNTEPTIGPVLPRTASGTSERSAGSDPSRPEIRSSPSNIEVLMSPVRDPDSEPTRPPLFDDSEDKLQREEEKRMEAIHAALTDIMAFEQEQADRTSKRIKTSSSNRTSSPLWPPDRNKRRAMFDDDEDEETDVDADADDAVIDGTQDKRPPFQLAGPGDLQLSYEIVRLGDNIANLEAQDIMLDTLIKKAELTGDTQELRLLVKSKSAMNRDLRELKFQKQQYEQQESANRLISDRTKVSIVSSTVGEEEGKSVVRYLVEIQQLAPDGGHASGWVVARRYNEFFNLHNKLRERYVLVRNLDFPGKRLVTVLSGSFVDTRRISLEKYLQNVVAIPVVCESDELRAFLSRDSPFVASPTPEPPKGTTFSGKDLVRNVYRSVTESIDDMFFGPSMLDVMIQRLTRQAAEFAGIVGSGIHDEDLVAQALNVSGRNSPDTAFLQLSGDLKPLEGETSTSIFSAPICDLVLAVFELNKQNNWLRRQAIVIILQQVLGGTIERSSISWLCLDQQLTLFIRKIRDYVKTYFEEPRLLSLIKLFRDGLWPGGKLKPPGAPRSFEEKMVTRDAANRKLSSLVPDLAANMIGRTNARRGARRMFAVLQNRRLNQHIAYTIVDEV
ncbi:hypothetical protein C0995_012936 [Termitomyces sp. Mi166|nr:hypothetical protein C0995_012936 [Termitomyces sp. Mi166\